MKRDSVIIASVLAWILPGAGHIYAGYAVRGMVLLVLITGTFSAGMLMEGGVLSVLGHPFSKSVDFISRICMLGRIAIGVPYIFALMSGLREGNMLAPYGEIGAAYTAVAGFLNFLVILSIKDLYRTFKTGGC